MRQTKYKEYGHFDKHLDWAQNSHRKFLNKLSEGGITEDHKAILALGLLTAARSSVITSYTIGKTIEEVQSYSLPLFLDLDRYTQEIPNADVVGSGTLEGYINCLWYLSFCYFFDAPRETVQLIADHTSLAGKDWLIDRLIAASIPGHPIAVGKLVFPEIYQPLADALTYDQTTEERTQKIQLFLKGYYPQLKKHQVTWHDNHKAKPNFYYHFGYWIFELGALAADIGWDDSAYRDHEMYPKDLVDWKFAQRPKDKQNKI